MASSSSGGRELGGDSLQQFQALVQSDQKVETEVFDFEVYSEFVLNAKRHLIAAPKKFPWDHRLKMPKVFHEMPKPVPTVFTPDWERVVRTKIGAIPQDDHQNPLVRSNGKSRLATVSWEQKLTAQRAAAIAKWKTISAVSLTSFQFGLQMQLDNSDVGDVLDDIFAGKATSTLHARADIMLRFLAWCRKSGHTAIPFSETVVYAFIQDEGSRSAATFPRSFCCALAFVGHVLECPSALECVASRRVTGHAAKCYKEKRMLVQKPPLKVEHVRML